MKINKAIEIEESNCPANCNGGLRRIWTGTKDEGNILCERCKGKGRIKRKELKELKRCKMRLFRLTWIISERTLKDLLKEKIRGTSAEKAVFEELSGEYCPKCGQPTEKPYKEKEKN